MSLLTFHGTSHFSSRLLRQESSFSESAGSVSILFGFAAVVLFALIGAAVDYSMTLHDRNRIQQAADAAILAAVKAASSASAANETDWHDKAVETGANYFKRQIGTVAASQIGAPTIAVASNGTTFDGSLTFNATYQNKFLQLIGFEKFTYNGVSKASSGSPSFIRVHLLIDVSPSMGIGATTADQALMLRRVGCTIACHYNEASQGWYSNYDAVKASGATMRVDVVRNSVKDLIETLSAAQTLPGQIELAIDIFSSRRRTILPPTTDLASANAVLNQIDLTTDMNNGGSNITHALNSVATALPAGGTGNNAASRQSFVVLISDGIENSVYLVDAKPGSNPPSPNVERGYDPNYTSNLLPWAYDANEILSTIKPTACDGLKAAKHSVATIHIRYNIPNDPLKWATTRFGYIRNTLNSASIASFKSCASSADQAVLASSTEEIGQAFEKLSDVLIGSKEIRLTQ